MTHLYVVDVAATADATADKAAAADERQLSPSAASSGRRTASRSRSTIARTPNAASGGHRGYLDRHGRRRIDPQAGDARTDRTRTRSGRPTERRSRSRARWRIRGSSSRTRRIAIVPRGGGTTEIRHRRDSTSSRRSIAWTPGGILFSGLEKTSSRLYQAEPGHGAVHRAQPGRQVTSIGQLQLQPGCARASPSSAATRGRSRKCWSRRFRRWPAASSPSFGDQINGWTVGTREVISWKSKDGATIEGVLHKPADFQAGRRYPLLVVIHGGPTGISRPVRVADGAAPIRSSCGSRRARVVLEPNYRGSAGYGEKFRSLNVRNLGVGDAWDVLSGVDYLVAQGIADPRSRRRDGLEPGRLHLGVPGDARAADRFKAISVGAGISDWMTYYVNTDIHPFTRQYLKATPWDDPEIYAKTSPMTYIKQAKTPTLIQHGEHDQRVPIPNAYELYQGLQDSERAGEADRLQGLRPRPQQAESRARGDGTQPRVVQPLRLRRGRHDDAGGEISARGSGSARPAIRCRLGARGGSGRLRAARMARTQLTAVLGCR